MTAEPFRVKGNNARPVRFTFDGKVMTGREGDTLAAALLANGVHLVARSFKYHRPRGIVAAGAEEPNAFVAVGEGARLDTNSQATRIELKEGLVASSLHAFPSPRWDLASVIGIFGRFLPAGFYYKTFFWPNWHLFEKPIRHMAGLGRAPTEPDPDRYEQAYRHCDVLIVGSGPAGLSAARAAALAGSDVLVIEQDASFGGALRWEDQQVDGTSGSQWAVERVSELAAMPNVALMTRTTATGYYDGNFVTAVEHGSLDAPGRTLQRLWRIRAAQVVLATGAIERPLVFPDNDRPGIMLASAVRQYISRYGVAAGRSVAVVTNNDDAYASVRALTAAGVRVAAVIDSRTSPTVNTTDAPVFRGATIVRTHGKRRVRAVTVRPLAPGRDTVIKCDVVAMSGGWSPAVQLFGQSGGKLRFDEAVAAFVPDQARQPTQVAGAAAGELTLAGSLRTGHAAGEAAARAAGFETGPGRASETDTIETSAIEPFWRVPPALAGGAKQWVDFHNDVTDADIDLAVAENFQSVEHVKRYTTLGMAPDQGKTSNMNGLAILGELTGRAPGAVGTTTFRPPFTPLTFGAIAGRNRGELFHPPRRLPTHDVQARRGAHLEDYGPWLRPGFYPGPGEDMEAAVAREVRAVRNQVGIIDYSPLGKIEVAGPDAAILLNRLVTTNVETLKPGGARYSLTLTEAGVISDDGIISRLADGTLLVGTTSGAADRMFALIDEWRQCELPHLKVWLTNVTTQWSVLMLSGPHARGLLARVAPAFDLSPAAFPHMTVQEGRIDGVPARIGRVSFTGEISYEVSVPAGYAASLWQRFFEQSDGLGLTPFGLEALDVLRIEKGFFHVGGDTDGATTPDDVGFGAMVRNKKVDFRGQRSLSLPGMNGSDRHQLVGFEILDGQGPLAVGAQVAASKAPERSSGQGMATSSVWSPTLGRPVALGLLAAGRRRIGERIELYDQGAWRPVQVAHARFFDPEGARLLD